MKIKLTCFIIILSVFLIGCKNGQKAEKMPENDPKMTVSASVLTDFEALLNESPRHHEWKTIESNGRDLYTFVAYPEVAEKAKTVIVIHENRGLNDWARYFADQLAAKGFIVLAPDLLSNFKEGIEKTTDFENSDQAREAIYELKEENVTTDLDAVYAYAKSIEAATGAVALVGFCWGGSTTFSYATHNSALTSANVFYGTVPENSESLKKIGAPVYGYYGGEDNRVNATIEKTKEYMTQNNKIYEPIIYEGAGHAFMRRGAENDSDEANKNAHDEAWKRLLEILK